MFYSKNENTENNEFKLSNFIEKLNQTVQEYGKMNNLKIEVLSTLDICEISFQLDYE